MPMHLPDASLSHVSPYYNPFHQQDSLVVYLDLYTRSPSSLIPYSIPPLVDLSQHPNLRFPAMESLSREELERFQKLSNEYEPDVQVSKKIVFPQSWAPLSTHVRHRRRGIVAEQGGSLKRIRANEPSHQGPLVSAKRSTHAISVEYANADPTLAAKTSVRAEALGWNMGE
jgi:hypothetical protein